MAEVEEHPLIKALPPDTDYLTYLTIVEYNLTKEQLPLFHEILQNAALTANIGWDLVHILLPLLPEAEDCLQDVARLGNPREVILKITELLGDIANRDDNEAEGTEEEEGSSPGLTTDNGEHTCSECSDSHIPAHMKVATLEFIALLRMLPILHGRIRTKQPSRFVHATLEAVLPAFVQLICSPEASKAVLDLIRLLAKVRKLQLRSTGTELASEDKLSTGMSAPDPEASTLDGVEECDFDTQLHLLRSFMTHVVESYIENLPAVGESSALAWSERMYERLHPEKIVPFRKSMTRRFQESECLQGRDSTVYELLRCAEDDLFMRWEELSDLSTIIQIPQNAFETWTRDGLLSQISPVMYPASRRGAMYLLTTRLFSSWSSPPKPLAVIDDHQPYLIDVHANVLKTYIGDLQMDCVGSEPVALIDAALAWGIASYEARSTDAICSLGNVEFHNYLQRLSLVSANTPSPGLRFQAHRLTSAMLHTHPSEQVRFNFIRDTLQYCPYENLKASAIGWLKDEMVEATSGQALSTSRETENPSQLVSLKHGDIQRLFSLPSTLRFLCPLIFPPERLSGLQDSEQAGAKMAFFLAAMNLLYLLCSSPVLRKQLEVAEIVHELAVHDKFVTPLKKFVHDLRHEQEAHSSTLEVELLGDALQRVESSLSHHIEN